jgi:hypothetical protein|tara:strand:- start:316 stop:747 length:432 start_codon:yes stop_codon:yes gene_type:complete
MITFVITKDKYEEKFECDLTDSILSLKKQIIERFKLKGEYVDIDFQIERPIRKIGKFNLEKGVIPRTLDLYTFDRYGLEGRTIQATFNEVEDYQPIQPIQSRTNNQITFNKDMSYSEFKRSGLNKQSGLAFDLKSDKDFPSLG